MIIYQSQGPITHLQYIYILLVTHLYFYWSKGFLPPLQRFKCWWRGCFYLNCLFYCFAEACWVVGLTRLMMSYLQPYLALMDQVHIWANIWTFTHTDFNYSRPWSPLLSSPLTDFEPQRGMDRYLDSLFDPVLTEGSEVCYIIHSHWHTWPPERGFFGQPFTVSYCTALFFYELPWSERTL